MTKVVYFQKSMNASQIRVKTMQRAEICWPVMSATARMATPELTARQVRKPNFREVRLRHY